MEKSIKKYSIGKEVVDKITIGDPLSNKELKEAITFYGEMVEGLKLLGPDFRLAWKEVYFIHELLVSYHEGRERGRKMIQNSRKG